MGEVVDIFKKYVKNRRGGVLGTHFGDLELRFVTYANEVGERDFSVEKRLENGEFKYLCTLDDTTLEILLEGPQGMCKKH